MHKRNSLTVVHPHVCTHVFALKMILVGLIVTSGVLAWYERSLPTDGNSRDKRTLSLDLDKRQSSRRVGQRSNLNTYTNTKIMVVWLESYEDCLNFPIGKYISVVLSVFQVN